MWIYHFDLDFSSNGTYITFNPIFDPKLLAKLISVISQELVKLGRCFNYVPLRVCH